MLYLYPYLVSTHQISLKSKKNFLWMDVRSDVPSDDRTFPPLMLLGGLLGVDRKTAFIGFIMAIDSVTALFKRLVLQPQLSLKYLLTYKLSQDFLELFFICIQAKGGFNNNPTARQFGLRCSRICNTILPGSVILCL